MPRIPRPLSIHMELTGPWRSPDRDRFLKQVKHIDINPRIASLLEKPTWSVASLMPPADLDKSEITREKLHHLLRLSALPPPANEAEESEMMETLAQQIHFVKEIQKVDTTGVEPLVAIRDETVEAQQESQFTKESLAHFLALEERRGKSGRIRRRRDTEPVPPQDTRPKRFLPEKADDRLKDPFALSDDPGFEADKKRGQYFVVRRSGKDTEHPG
ncbi:hypothetical protein EDD37DRAFT_320070 [Exophiala viscosa]|uniref:Glutamyl-tRNA amidotransferase complex subunit Gta3 domain-containing protein n=1 Tax=Exophiala viscosa TaxID=2486360 RepID=A0AAN6DWD0_9EURO|nr:hypothetical protein EDD36DRAFT_245928 [Exophiala viscosa]KAI1625863.1 hypothetical protein EDD37DRAFT_320070 [Exophiala viscosa]